MSIYRAVCDIEEDEERGKDEEQEVKVKIIGQAMIHKSNKVNNLIYETAHGFLTHLTKK